MSNLTKSIPADERKMLRKAFWRSFTLYAAVSPAKQGASGFCYSLMPFINKFYKNDEEGKKAALTRSMSYFNTTITLSTFIMGLVASMEKKNSSEQKDFDASGLMNILTKAASIVGLIMVGGMTASMVTFNSTYELTMKGESVLNLQNMLDQIFIGIVPLGLTLLCYYLLKKKNVSITVLIIGVIILSILLSLLGIA